MRGIGLIAVLFALLLACGGGTEEEYRVHPLRDAGVSADLCVFLWNGENYVERAEELVLSLKQNGISCLLFSSNAIDYHLSPDGRAEFASFVDRVVSAGIKFELVLSRNDWIFPDRRQDLIYILDLYRDFTSAYGREIPINLDIEPHAIEGQQNFIDPEIWALYMETLTEVRNRVNYLNPVISYVYRYYGFDTEVLPFADTLVVMLYITDLQRIEENAVYYRNITSEQGRGLRIAFSVERNPLGVESFYYRRKELLRDALRAVDGVGAEGIVLQDFEDLMSYLYQGKMVSMDMRDILHKLSEKENLSAEEVYSALVEMVEGNATDAQIGAFIMGTKMKGETVEEIEGAGRFFRERATKVEVSDPEDLVDTCGTGGDRSGTFNVSTVTAFVLAGAGVRVAKHGNRSVSSRCGSADFLEQAGAKIDLPAEKVARMIEEIGIGFMFAPLFHPAMKRVIGPRREVGVRSIFNLIGPLSNPAGAKRQILGVFSEDLVDRLAHVLKRLGIIKAFVVHGKDGIDEVSISGPTLIGEVSQEEVRLYEFVPEELGIERKNLAQVCISSPEESFRLGFSVLEGEEGPHRDIVLLNATFGILASGKTTDRREALEMARESIDSGRAKKKLEEFVELSNKL